MLPNSLSSSSEKDLGKIVLTSDSKVLAGITIIDKKIFNVSREKSYYQINKSSNEKTGKNNNNIAGIHIIRI